MKRTYIVILSVIILLLSHTLTAPAKKPGKILLSTGDPFPDLTTDYAFSSQDRDYLGFPKKFLSLIEKKTFSLRDIKADVIVVEFFNRYCTSCQAQAPVMNTVYKQIMDNAEIKDRVKFVGFGAGNNGREVEGFRQEKDIAFPLIPDQDFSFYEAIGDPGGTPFTLIVKKTGSDLIVAYAHMGLTKKPETFTDDIINAVKNDVATIKNMAKEKTVLQTTGRMLSLDMAETAVQEMVRQRMLAASMKDAVIKRFSKTELKNSGIVYRGDVAAGTGSVTLFSKIFSRNPVCDVCHGIHFIFTFNDKGTVVDFHPIHVTKYGNVLWDENDADVIKNKLIARPVKDGYTFNPEVDAVSQATMSSALIFNSFNKLQRIVEEQQQTSR